MADLNEELSKWFDELQKLPPEHHLLCPRISNDDEENYKIIHDPNSRITINDKVERIRKGHKRVEITYWNSLIFGFDKRDAGKWLVEFTDRLEQCLRYCSDCVLNWHMKRKIHLQKFSERWNEDAVTQIRELLDRLDVRRIGENLTWAKDFIEKIESTGVPFKKSQFGDRLPEVHVSIYEALCCVPYLADPEQRAVFQRVFMRLQGKKYLKLGTKDPLPGMTYFLFDQKNEDRRAWAQVNWKNIDNDSMTEEQFDWAVSGGLVNAIDSISKKDVSPQQGYSSGEVYLEIERFWQGFEGILRAMNAELIMARLRSLEVKPGSPSIYDLLFRHIYCRSEGVLVVIIRVLSLFLKKAPKAFWDVIGDARPNVVADMLFNSPVYPTLLRQSLENCWTGFDSSIRPTPFPTSWIDPWLRSIGRDRRYDACESLMHTLFEGLVKDASIGEPGQAACVRAGFDTLSLTMRTFLDPDANVGTGTSHLNASAALNLVMKHLDIILKQMSSSNSQKEGWRTFKVGDAAEGVMHVAMQLDIKLFLEEFHAIHNGKQPQTAVTRDSPSFWDSVITMFDEAPDQIALSREIMHSLSPMIAIEQIRPLKHSQLDESSKIFNKALSGTEDALARLFGRVSELDTTDLSSLFADRVPIQLIVGLSLHGETDLAEASSEVLKAWTGELSRSSAMEQMSQLHPDQTLASMIYFLDNILKPPFLWGPIRPYLNMSRDVMRGLADPSSGVLRTKTLDSRSVAMVIHWWNAQWQFVSKACSQIEPWSHYIQNAIMTEFCREIMELAEALIAEDGLISSATALGKSEQAVMAGILAPAKMNFRGMGNMIRLKDRWLIDVTVRVLCKILKRLREHDLEIDAVSRQFIFEACLPTGPAGKFIKATNMTDQQRAELLQALGHTDEEVQAYQLGGREDASTTSAQPSAADRSKKQKQSKLDAWSKSGSPSTATSSSSSRSKLSRSNRDDVFELSRSLESPILKQLEARRAKPQANDATTRNAILEGRKREKEEKKKRDSEAIARARQLRGLNGPDQQGAAAPEPKSEIMVNSSDEASEGDDSDSDNQLVALSTGGQKKLDDVEKQRQLALREKLRRPVKKVRQQRSVKEMRARLIPPMERLHNTVLAWDIFHEGNDPPTGPKANKVATKYSDPRSYQDTFFPLLASEAWRSFVTAKDEITAQPFGMKIASRASVDSFLEVTFTMPIVQNKERGVSEGDILLISEAQNPLRDPSCRHCLARVHRITYKKDLIEVTYRVGSRNQLSMLLTPGTSVHGIKITNMTTIEREYAALESLQYYDLMDEVLKAEPSPVLRYGDEKVSNWMQNWGLNQGQALAVLGAQDNDGFTLIQGPPGTGKTKTIVAMVGALLSEQLNQTPPAGFLASVPVRPAGTAGTRQRGKKLLVCAPSNAAVDELVLRLKGGIKTVGGKTKNVNVLRLGRTDAINASVKDVTLDELVRVRLEGDQTKDKAKADRDKLHEDAAKIRDELTELRPRLEEARGSDERASYNALSRQFDELKKRQMAIGKQIDANKDSGNSLAREMEMRRRQIQQEILDSAQVLCATLSGSGHDMFRNLDVEFETVIIDEAAQCVELSALIPLKYGCCKCILVGDPKQLPPTVLSQSAARFGYDQSLFVRMQQNHPQSVHLLDMQYRMHPEISVFPSREFYEGQLKDGQDMQKLRQMPWHNSALLGPYRFFDVQGVQERGRRGQSLVNVKELDVAMQIYERFSKDYHECDLRGKIGIITPYKAQLFELRNRFRSRFGEGISEVIEFNTTDAFQGRECEIIIFSCVRASSTGGIGFMTDIRRMNVGLTRAKSSLWVLGDSRALVQGEFWRKLIEDAKSRERYTSGDIMSMFRKPLERVKKIGNAEVAHKNNEDVVMVDAPAASVKNATTASRTSVKDEAAVKHDGVGQQIQRPDVGARSDVRPIIQTSSGKPPNAEAKKRSLDGAPSGQPGTKRVAPDKPRGGGLMSKFGQKSARAPKAPTDPSAMSLLGLTPPERPPPPPSNRASEGQQLPTAPTAPRAMNPTSNGSTSSNPHDRAQQNRPPPQGSKKKSKPSVFIKKSR